MEYAVAGLCWAGSVSGSGGAGEVYGEEVGGWGLSVVECEGVVGVECG